MLTLQLSLHGAGIGQALRDHPEELAVVLVHALHEASPGTAESLAAALPEAYHPLLYQFSSALLKALSPPEADTSLWPATPLQLH